MSIEDFISLPDNEQLKITFNKAQFVSSREKDNTIFVLYSMKSFFIEIEYDASRFSISSQRAFESDHGLNKYLNWDPAI